MPPLPGSPLLDPDVAPKVETLDEYKRAYTALFTKTGVWVTTASGALQGERILRHNTAQCLDRLESKGLIVQGN